VQLVAVHLVDSHYCSDPGKFISVLLTSLSSMVQVELPHVNILSKVDLMEQYGKLGEVYILSFVGPSSAVVHGRHLVSQAVLLISVMTSYQPGSLVPWCRWCGKRALLPLCAWV